MAGERDFVVELARDGEVFRVGIRSPAGEFTGSARLDAQEINADLEAVQANVLASSARVRSLVSGLERPLRRIGSELFRRVLGGPAQGLLAASRNEAERRGEPFRIVLRLPAELAVLPWELLFDDHRGEYVCRRSTLVRYVDAPETVRQVETAGPLRVLGMTALPGNLAALDAGTEREQLTEALAPLRKRGLVELDWVAGQGWSDLMDALLAGGPYHLFHFIGHGGFDTARGEGFVAFADARGRAQLIPAPRLAELLTSAQPLPHLVVLNSCSTATAVATDVFSSVGATLVRRIPSVIAMQFSITDDAAKEFSRAFYHALAYNRGIDEAVRLARIAVSSWHPDTLEWITPVLYMRSRDTHLITVNRGQRQPPAPPSPDVTAGTQPAPTSGRRAEADTEAAPDGPASRHEDEATESLADLDRAIELDPDDVAALTARGEIHRLAGRYNQALADFDHALHLQPDSAYALGSRGQTHRALRHDDEALADLYRAIELDPNLPWALVERGEMHRRAGRGAQALADFDRAIALDPDFARALERRGYVHRVAGRYAEALADYDRAVELRPASASVFAHRGETLRLLKRYYGALVDLNRAVELSPDYAWALMQRGEIHRALGHDEQALDDFERALRINPRSTWTRRRRDELRERVERHRAE
ncbi:CHAT domain-containing tetratricopeptide repeat protein [Streptomyces mayteni]